MCQLLGSTNKAEVLEAMEFFRVAWEYQFDSAEVSPPFPAPHPAWLFLTIPIARHNRSGSKRCYISSGPKIITALHPRTARNSKAYGRGYWNVIAVCTLILYRIWSLNSKLTGLRRI